MPDAPATNGSFGQRIRNFLWENKNYIFLTGCFAGVLAALVVYMMKQRSELKTVVNECTELKKAMMKQRSELKTVHINLLETENECTELKKAMMKERSEFKTVVNECTELKKAMMKQRSELKTVHINLLETENECTELKKAVKEHNELMKWQKDYFGRRWARFVSSDENAFQKKFELSWEKLISLITK